MTEKEVLTLNHLKSTPVNGRDYVATIKEEKFRKNYQNSYDKFNPNPEILEKIKSWIVEKDEDLQLIGIGAVWCHDCWDNIPLVIKIEESLNTPKFKMGVVSGVKVKPPYDRKKGEYIWKVPPSPPEANDSLWDLTNIPIIYIFGKSGKLLGKIVEKPKKKKTMEEEILYHLDQASK